MFGLISVLGIMSNVVYSNIFKIQYSGEGGGGVLPIWTSVGMFTGLDPPFEAGLIIWTCIFVGFGILSSYFCTINFDLFDPSFKNIYIFVVLE